jgi:hypothetical protein
VKHGRKGVTGVPLFSLKGWNKAAQGNVLGPRRPEESEALEGNAVKDFFLQDRGFANARTFDK